MKYLFVCLFFFFVFSRTHFSQIVSLTIIPRARMGSKSIAYEAEWAIDSEAMRARGIIVLVKSN